MAQSYQLIGAQTLSSTTATVTFSNIPQNYTDLIIKFSARMSNSANVVDDVGVALNGSSSNFSMRRLFGDGAIVYSDASAGNNNYVSQSPNASATANTFGNAEFCIANYTGSTFKSISVDAVSENNATTSYLLLNSVLWSNTAAITSLSLSGVSSSFLANSTFYLYGIGGSRASGGTITADENYTYHTFTSTGTFTTAEKIRGAEALVIAGGGAGAAGSGGGGGAGGVVYVTNQLLNAGNTYTITVGAGGTGATGTSAGASGSNSSISSFTALGGGGGGNRHGGTPNGVNGGSAGGGAVDGYVGGTATQTSGLNYIGYGNNGGSSPGGTNPGGGGGGAGAAGQEGGTTNTSGGDGGVGTSLFSTWGYATSTGELSSTVYYYAGGGGGSWNNAASGDGGLGGGASNGKENNTAGASATANTGGGGGSGTGGTSAAGGSGGSGLVIIRYPNS